MKVFLAHTREDATLADTLANGLKAHGFSASVGQQVSVFPDSFFARSFRDRAVERAIRSADCMIAIATVYEGFEWIAREVAFFAGNSNFKNSVLVTRRDLGTC